MHRQQKHQVNTKYELFQRSTAKVDKYFNHCSEQDFQLQFQLSLTSQLSRDNIALNAGHRSYSSDPLMVIPMFFVIIPGLSVYFGVEFSEGATASNHRCCNTTIWPQNRRHAFQQEVLQS